jgi:hypothetical protein
MRTKEGNSSEVGFPGDSRGTWIRTPRELFDTGGFAGMRIRADCEST